MKTYISNLSRGIFPTTTAGRTVTPPPGVDPYGIRPLFQGANANQGVWYDPSDTTTLYQDLAGTVPVVASGQSVGMMKDKSGNGYHMVAPSTAGRPVYTVDGNGKGYLKFVAGQFMTTLVNSPIQINNQTGMIAFQEDTHITGGRLFSAGVANGSGGNNADWDSLFGMEIQTYGGSANFAAVSMNSTGAAVPATYSGSTGPFDIFQWTLTTTTGNTSALAYRNGIVGPAGPIGGVANATNTGPLAIGTALTNGVSIGTPSNGYFIGKWYGAVILGRTATTAEREFVRMYGQYLIRGAPVLELDSKNYTAGNYSTITETGLSRDVVSLISNGGGGVTGGSYDIVPAQSIDPNTGRSFLISANSMMVSGSTAGATAFGPTTNWTWETWFRTTFSGLQGLASKRATGTTTNGFYVILSASGTGNLITMQYNPGGAATTVSSDSVVPLNAWTHVAVVNRQGNFYMYVNGVLQSGVDAQRATTGAYNIGIGAFTIANNNPLRGHFDKMRMWNYDRYAGNFTPSTS